MSVINFPFNLKTKNESFLNGSLSSYIPPGQSNGQRSSASYTVPAETRSLITVNANIVLSAFAGSDLQSILVNRNYAFNATGVSGDVFVIFVQWYYATTLNNPYTFEIFLLKNGTTIRSVTGSGQGNSFTPNAVVNSSIEANEFDL